MGILEVIGGLIVLYIAFDIFSLLLGTVLSIIGYIAYKLVCCGQFFGGEDKEYEI